MKLGLLTAPFPQTPLVEVAGWAATNGFEALEVACWPASEGAQRRYAGTSHIDVAGLSPERAREIVDELASKGISISGLGYYPNPLHPDVGHRAVVVDHLGKVIDAAGLMGVPVVNTFIGADASKTQDQNWETALTVWPDIVRRAQDRGVRIAIENCPMIFSYDEWPSGHNLAYSPRIWRRMFEAFGETVGLNLDPSHLVWQMIDIERVVREFGPRIWHVHAKDLQIDREGLYEHGILSLGMGWQVPRLPGLGDVPWARLFSALYRVGYDGVICVEHEDRAFEGSDELVKRGFLLARDVLRPWVV
ncbi:MAG: sugar phosphate isomerase/epimerase [Chloroflexi bacterium]|nr:sugar phosphate isomerase/epimerase [Chloroflexota bacterium]